MDDSCIHQASIYMSKFSIKTHSMVTYCTLCGQIKGTPGAVSIIQQHGLRGGTRYTARHVITVIVLAFLTQENKAGKMQSTIKHGKGRAVRAIMVLGVVSIDHYCTYSTSFHALTNT